MIWRMIYLTSTDIYELDHEVSDQSTIQSKKILQPEYHMSDHQSDGAITVVANHLFGEKEYREWKKYMANSETTKNTLPAHGHRRRLRLK